MVTRRAQPGSAFGGARRPAHASQPSERTRRRGDRCVPHAVRMVARSAGTRATRAAREGSDCRVKTPSYARGRRERGAGAGHKLGRIGPGRRPSAAWHNAAKFVNGFGPAAICNHRASSRVSPLVRGACCSAARTRASQKILAWRRSKSCANCTAKAPGNARSSRAAAARVAARKRARLAGARPTTPEPRRSRVTRVALGSLAANCGFSARAAGFSRTGESKLC